MPFTAETMQVGQLLAHPYVIEAPSYQRSFPGRKRRRPSCSRISPRRRTGTPGPPRRLLPRHHAVHRARPANSRGSWAGSAPDSVARRGGRLPEADHSDDPVLRPARSIDDDDGQAPQPPPAGRDQHRARRKGPPPAVGRRLRSEEFFLDYVRTPGATGVAPESTARSPAEKRILEVRDHFVATLMDYERSRPPPARRLPARPLPRRVTWQPPISIRPTACSWC